jgi:hypothetical protein
MRRYLRLLYIFCSLAILVGLAGSAVQVTAAKSNTPAAVTQSYSAPPSVLAGMLVELKSKDTSTVIPLTTKDLGNMLGVVVPLNDASIVLTPQSGSTQQVLVATSGSYNLLVSSQNGAIKTGDLLTISSLDGVTMKADATQPEIVGRALGNFGSKSGVIGSVTQKNSAGKTSNVSIGHIPVDVYLAPNPLYQKNSDNLPGFLTKAASAVASKPVNSLRIYLSVLVLVATIIVAGIMFYGSVRSSIIAVGRNPLAKKAITRSLVQTILAALIVFISGLLAGYLILKF